MELNVIQQVTTNKSDIDNLKRWQKDQNGSIIRVEGKIDKLIFWFMTFAVTTGGALVVNIVFLILNKGG